jgi:hypothetical protein
MIAVDQCAETSDRQQCADEAERGFVVLVGLGDQHRTRNQRDGDDRDVRQEDRTPPEVLEQPAADHSAEGGILLDSHWALATPG